jgi:hypothetical protein
MERIATIIDFHFYPREEIVPSQLDIIYQLENGHTTTLIDTGSIDRLSKKYGFTVSPPRQDPVWDFTGFKGRKCVIWFPEQNPGDAHFIRFAD